MTIKRFIRQSSRAALCALLLGQLAACQQAQEPELRGSLYFGAGEYLAQLDLRDGSTSVVANIGDVQVQEISAQYDERLLLTVLGSVNRQQKHQLVLYDLDSKQTLTLLNGRHGRYLPGSGILVFDDGSGIVVAQRSGPYWNRTRVTNHAFNATVSILPISASRFLYAIGDGPGNVYDTADGRSRELAGLGSICALEGALWLDDRDALLCRSRGDESHVLAGLDGTLRDELPMPSTLHAVAWLPDQQALVLTEQWRSWYSDRWKSAIWVYRFETGQAHRLVDDQYLGAFVVYEPS